MVVREATPEGRDRAGSVESPERERAGPERVAPAPVAGGARLDYRVHGEGDRTGTSAPVVGRARLWRKGLVHGDAHA